MLVYLSEKNRFDKIIFCKPGNGAKDNVFKRIFIFLLWSYIERKLFLFENNLKQSFIIMLFTHIKILQMHFLCSWSWVHGTSCLMSLRGYRPSHFLGRLKLHLANSISQCKLIYISKLISTATWLCPTKELNCCLRPLGRVKNKSHKLVIKNEITIFLFDYNIHCCIYKVSLWTRYFK